jgi:hypothetical protein
MQEAEFIGGGGAESADEISEHAIEAGFVGMQLLVRFGSGQQLPGGGRQFGGGFQIGAGARIGEIEMQPDPALHGWNWLIDRQLVRRSIGVEAEGRDEARQGLRLHIVGLGSRHVGGELQQRPSAAIVVRSSKGPLCYTLVTAAPQRS